MKKQDKKSAIKKAKDRKEPTSAMEPLLISETCRHRRRLQDMAIDLAGRAAGFQRSLPPTMRGALADMVRSMNCYYSNLIEGHDTHPIDIERALNGDYSTDAKKRNLQLEAMAHIAVQKWIDDGALKSRSTSVSSLKELHQKFCALLPEELLWVEDEKTGEQQQVVPGEFRRRDVAVGSHIAISPGAVPRFLARFEEAYDHLGKSESILSAAAAHHRLLWIHPFIDGNGRVARLMSHATFLDLLDTGGLWSIARGLARSSSDYKSHLAACDMQRRNDLDGRGNLSEEALAAFTEFFFEISLDQVAFMESLMQPDRLRARILTWAQEETVLGELPAQAGQILQALLYRGELPRAEIPSILNVTDRHARRVVAALVEKKILSSDTPKSSLHLVFPAHLAARWMPGLFPEQTIR